MLVLSPEYVPLFHSIFGLREESIGPWAWGRCPFSKGQQPSSPIPINPLLPSLQSLSKSIEYLTEDQKFLFLTFPGPAFPTINQWQVLDQFTPYTVKSRYSLPAFNIIPLIEHTNIGPKKNFYSYLMLTIIKTLVLCIILTSFLKCAIAGFNCCRKKLDPSETW